MAWNQEYFLTIGDFGPFLLLHLLNLQLPHHFFFCGEETVLSMIGSFCGTTNGGSDDEPWESDGTFDTLRPIYFCLFS